MNWSSELHEMLSGLTKSQQRAIERIVLAEAEGEPLTRLLKDSYSCQWCGSTVGRWSDSVTERTRALSLHESECQNGQKPWKFIVSASTYYGVWLKNETFVEALQQARDEFGAMVLDEAASLLRLGTLVAARELLRIIQESDSDTDRRLAALGWLDRASALTARKGKMEIQHEQIEQKNNDVAQLLEELREAA